MTAQERGSSPFAYVVRHADDLMINAQRLSEYMTRAPELEEELAVANTALDKLGVAIQLYQYAADVEGGERSADDLAFLRTEREYTNALIVEQPHQDFADVVVRQMFVDGWHLVLWPALAGCRDSTIAGIAAKAAMEAKYHFRHSAEWVRRLGDGTRESTRRAQRAVNNFWRFTGELTTDDAVDIAAVAGGWGVLPSDLAAEWNRRVQLVIVEATLRIPEDRFQASGGRNGSHTEHLGHLLAEMQFMQRAYPGMVW